MLRTQLADHKLVKECAGELRKYLRESVNMEGGKFIPTRPLTPHEEYVKTVFIGISNVLGSLDQLHFAADMLSGYRSSLAPKAMTRLDWILYNRENFVIRTTTVYDRSLRLVNMFLRLGLPGRECRAGTILDNSYVKGTSIAKALKQIDQSVKLFREDRNRIIHSEALEDAEIGDVAAYFRMLDDPTMKPFAPGVKRIVDDVVRSKRQEYSAATKDLEAAVRSLFDKLLMLYSAGKDTPRPRHVAK